MRKLKALFKILFILLVFSTPLAFSNCLISPAGSGGTSGVSGGTSGSGGAVVGEGGGTGLAGTPGSAGTAGYPPPPAAITPNPGDIGIPIASNCSVISDTTQRSLCETFVSNETQFVLPALEDISGLSLRDCLDSVRFEFNASIAPNLGQAYTDSRVGIIQFSSDLTTSYFTGTLPQAFDDHEPVHILFQCAHVPYTHNFNHAFFFGVQAELNAAAFTRSGNSLSMILAYALTNANRDYVNYWDTNLTTDPSPFGQTGMFNGCPGVATYLLLHEYNRPNHDIVRTWFTTIHGDATLAALPYSGDPAADARYVQLVQGLTSPDASTRSRLSPYCSSITP